MSDLTKRTLPPSGLPDQMSSPEQAEAYYRRVNRTGMPIRIQRASSVITALSMTFLTGYAVFFADFGDHEHVFSPPRRWLDRQKKSFFSLSDEEKATASQLNASSPTSSTPPPESQRS